MKVFIKRTAGFIAFVLLTMIVLQLILSLRISGRSTRGDDNLQQITGINADLVLLGSSRCLMHFDPGFFNSVFHVKTVNLGVHGHSEISMAVTRLKDYLGRNKPPKFAIMTFDPFASVGSETDNKNFLLKADFARYAFLPGNKDQLILNYFKFNCWEKYIPLYAIFRYRLLADYISLEKGKNYERYGHDIHDQQWDTIAYPVTAIMKKNFFKENAMDSISNSLSRLNQLCVENNIKLLCMQTPVYKVIYDDRVFANTRIICTKLGIPFIDANKDFIRNDIRYFYNSNHMNKQGVEAMNEMLRTDEMLHSFFENKLK